MKRTQISIIIPTLNEADRIGRLLLHLDKNAKFDIICEVIIADGGSSDQTLDSIKQVEGELHKIPLTTVVSSSKSRARQMNAGAAIARGSILYFLHADSFPPQGFDQHIIQKVHQGHQAGCFRMRFDSNHWWLRLASWLTQFSWRACRGGDQSQFITAQLFKELGGFDENFEIYEDNDLINKLYARKEFVVIQKKLTTSSRRYQSNGIWKLQYHFWAIYVKKWFGASPEELHDYYKKHIVS